MCWFLYLAVTPAASPLVEAWRQSRLGIRVQRSALEEGHFPNGLTVLQVTRGGCSCAWVAPQAGGAEGSARRVRDLRRGWSAAKIERAIQANKTGRAIQRPDDAVRAQLCEALAQLAERAGPVYAYARWEGRGAPRLLPSLTLPPNELRRLGCIPGHTRLVIAEHGQ